MHNLIAFVTSTHGVSSTTSMPLCMTIHPMNEFSSRRGFIRSSGVLTAGTAAGWFVNLNNIGNEKHTENCQCGDCGGLHADGCDCGACVKGQHDLGCSCGNCGIRFGPSVANAYERDVGDNTRSADTYAMNLQARETNARLEKSGFKLDTKEEEAARLSDAFASFSYDSNVTKGQKSSVSSYASSNIDGKKGFRSGGAK